MEAEKDAVRVEQLRTRLCQTLDCLVHSLIEAHALSTDAANLVRENSETMKTGFDLVLVEGMYAYDAKVPEHLQGGAIIAYSADAFSSLSAAINKPESEKLIGSWEDKKTLGNMCAQLGFSPVTHVA